MSLRRERIALLDRYTRIPTLSRRVTPEQVEAVRALWSQQGLELAPLSPPDGSGTPALYGEISGPHAAPTLLLYGHYDVQPTGDPRLWVWNGVACDPFAPTYFLDGERVDAESVAETDLERLLMVARGGADNKGQHMANLLGALDAAARGELQWSVKVLLDGEEEHGSPHLAAIAATHREQLRADLLIGSDGPKQRNHPTLLLGVRGLLIADLVAENGAPASLHSGNYGNILANPTVSLLRAVERIEEEVREYAAEHNRFRQEATAAFAPWATRATWAPFLWPTVNVNHVMSEGASPELTRTIIPRSVHARLDVRLTPDTPPAAVRRIIETAAAQPQQGISLRVTTGDDLPASYTSPQRPEFEWLLRLLAADGEEPLAMPVLGGTLPAFVFTDLLAMPVFWLPAANSDNQQHDSNEHYVLRHFFNQIEVYRRIASSRP